MRAILSLGVNLNMNNEITGRKVRHSLECAPGETTERSQTQTVFVERLDNCKRVLARCWAEEVGVCFAIVVVPV